MAKKLVLKIPPADEKSVDLILLILGAVVIGYALYMGGVFNGSGKVIDATSRFGKQADKPGNASGDAEGNE